MPINLRVGASFRPGLSFILLAALLALLWVGGGASRAEVFGQVLVRKASVALIVIEILLGGRYAATRAKPVLLLLSGTAVLTLLQLVPLPPAIWEALPGRQLLIEPMRASNLSQPWRPLSMVPSATINAAASLIVPAAVFLFTSRLSSADRKRLPGFILTLVTMSMLLGLLQFSGFWINNPFINDTSGQVSGPFANRNHFALFLALGCVMAPAWAFVHGRESRWRAPVAFGIILLLVLTVLASGSRTGMLLTVLSLVIGFVLVRHEIKRTLRHYPRWVFPALVCALVGVIGFFVAVSFTADRALAVTRTLTMDPGQDMRSKGLPTVLVMVRQYFPFGSGAGGFDPIFRIHEPFDLLKRTYFNHAHNDFLEVVLDTGLAGLLLLVAALLWWARASARVWRTGIGTQHLLARLGSAILLLVFVASAFDYPARTPMIMAMLVIGAIWLSNGAERPAAQLAP